MKGSCALVVRSPTRQANSGAIERSGRGCQTGAGLSAIVARSWAVARTRVATSTLPSMTAEGLLLDATCVGWPPHGVSTRFHASRSATWTRAAWLLMVSTGTVHLAAADASASRGPSWDSAIGIAVAKNCRRSGSHWNQPWAAGFTPDRISRDPQHWVRWRRQERAKGKHSVWRELNGDQQRALIHEMQSTSVMGGHSVRRAP